MSSSPKLLAHDLEKGHPTATRGSVFVLPQRRRKLIIASLLLFATLFFVYAAERNGSLLSSGSWRWVKDSMKPASLQEETTVQTVETDVHALSTPSPPTPTDAASLGAHEVHPASTDPGSEKHASLPGASAEDASSAKAVQRDQVLLLLSAMKNKEYRVPELQVQRAEELMPSSTPAFVKALDKVQSKEAADSTMVSRLTILGASCCSALPPTVRRLARLMAGKAPHSLTPHRLQQVLLSLLEKGQGTTDGNACAV